MYVRSLRQGQLNDSKGSGPEQRDYRAAIGWQLLGADSRDPPRERHKGVVCPPGGPGVVPTRGGSQNIADPSHICSSEAN